MKLLSLFITTFLGAFGLGAAKYFGLGYLLTQPGSVPSWIAQLLGAIMTIGPAMIFPLIIPLGHQFARSSLMALCLLLSGLISISGLWFTSYEWVWIQLFNIGLCMGAYGMIRTSLIPIFAKQNQISLTFLNACISVLFIVGLISGLIFGRYSFEAQLTGGWTLIAILFFLPLPFTFFLKTQKVYVAPSQLKISTSLANSLDLLQKHGLYLLGSTSIWGIASALTLAITLNLEMLQIASPVKAAYMSIFAALGGILGNLVSAKLHNKPEVFSLIFSLALSLSLLMWTFIFSDSFIHSNSSQTIYLLSSSLITLQGLAFGISTNLLDSKFLKLCHHQNREIEGATLQSAFISLACFLIGSVSGFALLLGWMSTIQQYIYLSATGLAASGLIFLLAFQDSSFRHKLLDLGQFTLRFLLRLRYRWNHIDIPQVKNPNVGTLILPNHPAEMDPVLMENIFWKTHRPRPVMDSSFYHLKGFHSIFKTIGAFPIPDLGKAPGTYAQVKIKESLQEIADALKNGEHVLFYPSGQLKRNDSEKLGSNSGLYKILELVPEANLLLVNCQGMWGSRFSTHPHQGQSPNLIQQLKTSFIDLMLNAFIFMPKRQLKLRVEAGSEALKQHPSPQQLNRALEQWYNSDGPEKPRTIKPVFWKPNINTGISSNLENEQDNFALTQEHQPLLQSIAEYCETPLETISPSTHLIDDLGLDSLARMELYQHLENELQYSFPQPEKIFTISDLITMQHKHDSSMPHQIGWPTLPQKETQKIRLPEASNLAIAFLKQNDLQNQNSAIVADGDRGSLSSTKFKQCITAIANSFQGDSNPIGICLPASSLAGASLLAAMLTKRLAVPLNWTVGPRAWNHAIKTAGVKTIFTSRQFLNKANLPIEQSKDLQWIIWEDLIEGLSLGEKWNIQLKSKLPCEQWENEYNLQNFNADSPAVLLFTSGSESLPKGVPLTHNNLLRNLHSCIDRMNLYCQDILMGFLPPFHAFGLTITTLLPLLTGIKVVYSPNPTHTNALKRHIKIWKPNLICGTPTFFKNLLAVSKPEDLISLNTYITGAEACPNSLKQELKQHGEHVLVLEGYGMTEAGPVLCLQNPELNSEGVGAPLKDIDLIIVDPNTHQACRPGETGLILAKGPNFFSGYYQSDKNPWIEIQSEQWYNTGDLGKLNHQGELILEGRLSRFVKVAGEMVSLPALEKALYQKYSHDEEIELVVMPQEKEGERPVLTLFSNRDIDLKITNQHLREAGFSGLSRIHQFKKIERIPTLGTGKTDFKELKNLLESEAA